MKKVLSILMAAAMLISCFAMTTSVMAEKLPELKLGSGTEVSVPKNGDYDNETELATFTPAATGDYVFYTTTNFKSKSTTKYPPIGVMEVTIPEDGEIISLGGKIFADLSETSKEVIDELKKEGDDVEHLPFIKFTAHLEANKKYTVKAYQDGTVDYTAELMVEKHTHNIKKGLEKKVNVNKNGKSGTNGGIYTICTDWFCYYEVCTTEYPEVVSTSVKKNVVYTGKALKPAVTVENEYGRKLNSKYYTISYKNNKKIGKGTVTVKFRNGYTGTVTKNFNINPKKTAVKKLTAGKAQIKARYAKVANSSGYQLQVATNKKFTKNKKTVTVKGSKKLNATAKKLKRNKKYYVRVRSYKTVKGKKYYSSWTKVKTVKTK